MEDAISAVSMATATQQSAHDTAHRHEHTPPAVKAANRVTEIRARLLDLKWHRCQKYLSGYVCRDCEEIAALTKELHALDTRLEGTRAELNC